LDDPIANSSQFVLPTMTAPADSSLRTTVASYGGMNVSRILDEAVVRIPRTQRLSLSATGTPPSGPSDAPPARMRSTSAARARARSAAMWLKALSDGFSDSMRASEARHTSVAEMRPAAMSSRMARAVESIIESQPFEDR
jgi:hypothetical protein